MLPGDECPPRERRRVELQYCEDAARPEDACRLFDDDPPVVHVVEGVENQHRVDRLVSNRERPSVPANRGHTTVGRPADHPWCWVDDERGRDVEAADALSGPAAHVENAGHVPLCEFEGGCDRGGVGRWLESVVDGREAVEQPDVAGRAVVCHGGETGHAVVSVSHRVQAAGVTVFGMDFAVRGWPPDGPTLRLDHERFSYAGKFVMSNTGKAVVLDDGEVVAAVSFNEDRTDAETLWLRYVTVRADRRGEGIGPRLIRFVTERAHERGYDRVRIAVNNVFAYEALSRAGFGFTGEETGIAELVLEHPSDRSAERYRRGFEAFRDRDLSADERAFLARKLDSDPPPVVSVPE